MIHSYLLSVDLTRVRTIVPVARTEASDELGASGSADGPMPGPGAPWHQLPGLREAQTDVARVEASPA